MKRFAISALLLAAYFFCSGSVSGGSSSSVSLEREKFVGEDKERQSIIKEGPLHCKITDIDGKVGVAAKFNFCTFYLPKHKIAESR